MGRFKLFLFGSPRLERVRPERQDEPVDIRRRKALAMLAYVALTAQPHSREALAALFWPELDHTRALANLRRNLSRLKASAAEELFRADRHEVTLDPSLDLWIDAVEFRRLLDAVAEHGHFPAEPCDDCLQRLTRAVALYQDEFMAGFSLPDCPEFDSWQFFEGDSLRLALANALQQLIRWHKAQSAFDDALAFGRRWLSLDPLHEAAHRQLMALYAHAGQQAAALRQYEECARLLDEELGVAPEAETRELYNAIRKRRFPPDVAQESAALPGERYVLEEQLAIGGQAVVYRGRDRHSGERVIIKQLRRERLGDPESVARFLREGEALRQLNHPNIVRMLDAVEQEDRHTLVMEYVHGGTLRDLLDRQGPLPLQQTLNLALELADALSRAHHLGILHRDIKPDNVLLTEEGAPRLTDFGIARLESADARLTRTGSTLGSPAYMSPEALRGEQLDACSDIWSFGVLLYEMLAGRRPFEGDTVTHVLVKILEEAAPDLAALRPELPPALTALVTAMLRKDRRHRPQSMRRVSSALEAIREGRAPEAVAPPATAPEEPPAPPAQQILPAPAAAQPSAAGPSPALAIAAAPGAPAWTPSALPPPLPARTTPFFGRRQELQELAALIDDPAVHLLTIVGPGGIGKTQLALEAGRAVQAAFADGAYFIPLAPVTAGDESSAAEEIVFAIAQSLGLHFYRQSDTRQQLFDYLQRKELLLLLDNFEHLLDGATLLADIVEAAPGVTLLVTSRSSLNLSFQTLYTLSGLTFPQEGADDEDPTAYPAVQLLLQQAHLVRAGFQPDDEDLRHMARIARLVQGMPLALVLAARWAELLSMAEIAAEIARNLDFLETTMRDVPQRQRSVRAVFDYSWQQLSPRMQGVFARLAVFRGGFTRPAAQEIADADLRTLLALVRKSFLAAGRRDRYEIHELLRQYGEEQLEALGQAEQVRDAHSAYFLRFLARREAEVKGQRQREALDEIESEYQNIRTAWDRALQQRNRQAVNQALETLHLFCDIRGRHQEGIELFGRARQQLAPPPGEAPDVIWGRIVTRHGFLQVLVPSRPRDVGAALEQGLSIAQEHGDRYEIAIGLLANGLYAAAVLGNADRAYDLNQRAYELFQKLQEPFFLARALVGLGLSSATRSEPQLFADYVRQAVEVARDNGDIVDAALGLSNLAEFAVGMGRYDEAGRYCGEALGMAREIGVPTVTAFCQVWQACIELLQGNVEAATTTSGQSLSLAENIHSQTVMAYASSLQALTAGLSGEHEKALRLAQESLANPTNNTLGLILAPWALAIACHGLQERDAAWDALTDGLQQARALAFPAPPLWLLPVAAVLLAEEGHTERAVELLALASTHPLTLQDWTAHWPPLQGIDARLRQTLGDETYQEAWQRGQELDLNATVNTFLDNRD
ncbi:MAG: protein kinase domain-containing protein [bacterium]